jgi:hypothetical protein
MEVDVQAGTAVSRSYFTALQAVPGLTLRPIASGRYHDDAGVRPDGETPAGPEAPDGFSPCRCLALERRLRGPRDGPAVAPEDADAQRQEPVAEDGAHGGGGAPAVGGVEERGLLPKNIEGMQAKLTAPRAYADRPVQRGSTRVRPMA